MNTKDMNQVGEIAGEWLKSTDSTTQAMVYTLVEKSKDEERERIVRLLKDVFSKTWEKDGYNKIGGAGARVGLSKLLMLLTPPTGERVKTGDKLGKYIACVVKTNALTDK